MRYVNIEINEYIAIKEKAENWDTYTKNSRIETWLEATDKLEAVKKWVEKHGDSVGMYQANWDELDKILESSQFKENPDPLEETTNGS